MVDLIEQRTFLGKGWSFPPTFSRETRSVDIVAFDDDINQSLSLLLATLPGERVLRPDFGCDLHGLVFNKSNKATEGRIISVIAKAIAAYEHRITVDKITVEFQENRAYINIAYTIVDVNHRSNIVYPFYLIEGTNVTEV